MIPPHMITLPHTHDKHEPLSSLTQDICDVFNTRDTIWHIRISHSWSHSNMTWKINTTQQNKTWCYRQTLTGWTPDLNHQTNVLQDFCNKYNIICYTESQLLSRQHSVYHSIQLSTNVLTSSWYIIPWRLTLASHTNTRVATAIRTHVKPQWGTPGKYLSLI